MNSELFKNKYRIESTRLKNWDYSSEGYYFITINTKNRKNYFGEIKNGIMIKNKYGNIAEKYWHEIPKYSPNAILDEFIIMPNHIHGILVLPIKTPHCCVSKPNGKKNESNETHWKPKTHCNPETQQCSVYTGVGIADTAGTGMVGIADTAGMGDMGDAGDTNKKSISTIIRSYKSICTKMINKSGNEILFAWQPRFYDRIIRNQYELFNVRRYINNNVLNFNNKK